MRYIWLTKRMVVLLTVGHCAMKFKRSLAVNEAMQQPVLAAITYSSLQNKTSLELKYRRVGQSSLK